LIRSSYGAVRENLDAPAARR